MKPVRVHAKRVNVNGKSMTYRQVAKMLGISRAAVSMRVLRGKDPLAERGDSRSDSKAAIRRRRAPVGAKSCQLCNAVFSRRSNESVSTFAARIACSAACGNAIKRKPISVFGVDMERKEVCRMLGIGYRTLVSRLRSFGSPFLPKLKNHGFQ